ncbi:MAG: heavy-metal-associated domain-containing protein [Chloroflexota bacterium]|nr:heavy-metal-associated domain-containing protein [Chloroflexota bacterium]
MTTKTYTVPAISCGHCVKTIERELKFVDGVQSVKASEATKTVLVEADSEETLPAVQAMLVEIGYPPSN